VKVTFKCHIETPTESFTDEYELDAEETAEFEKLDAAAQARWKDQWAETAFLNACSYGTALEIEP
jgi:hypothetical protein